MARGGEPAGLLFELLVCPTSRRDEMVEIRGTAIQVGHPMGDYVTAGVLSESRGRPGHRRSGGEEARSCLRCRSRRWRYTRHDIQLSALGDFGSKETV